MNAEIPSPIEKKSSFPLIFPQLLKSSLISFREWTKNDFINQQFLSKGKFGLVYKAQESFSDQTVALKLIKKDLILRYNMQKQLRREAEIHSHLKHQHIIQMYGYFHDEANIYFVMEYAENGSLFNHFEKKRRFSEPETARIVLQIASALDYMAQRMVIHRDLKLENILLDANNNVKLADFGWAVHTKSHKKRETLCGTLQYLAPEILNTEGYDETLDIWCLGIITFELLFAKSPFESQTEDPEGVLDRIAIVDFQFFEEEGLKISDSAKDFIRKLLEKDPELRLKPTQIRDHDFIKNSL